MLCDTCVSALILEYIEPHGQMGDKRIQRICCWGGVSRLMKQPDSVKLMKCNRYHKEEYKEESNASG